MPQNVEPDDERPPSWMGAPGYTPYMELPPHAPMPGAPPYPPAIEHPPPPVGRARAGFWTRLRAAVRRRFSGSGDER